MRPECLELSIQMETVALEVDPVTAAQDISDQAGIARGRWALSAALGPFQSSRDHGFN